MGHVHLPNNWWDAKADVAIAVDDELEGSEEEGSNGGRRRSYVEPTRLVRNDGEGDKDETLAQREDAG